MADVYGYMPPVAPTVTITGHGDVTWPYWMNNLMSMSFYSFHYALFKDGLAGVPANSYPKTGHRNFGSRSRGDWYHCLYKRGVTHAPGSDEMWLCIAPRVYADIHVDLRGRWSLWDLL